MSTTFSFPTITRFGVGCLRELPETLGQLGVRRPLVVTDSGLLETDAFRRLRSVLGDEGGEGGGKASRWKLFSGVHPNPLEADVGGAAAAYREADCDGIVAVGGGSALDVGKAVRLFLQLPDLRLADFDPSMKWPALAPCVCIPTTAGTGSEVGRSSVITADGTRRKVVIGHPSLMADRVFLDPELTVGLPLKLTAATGVDALTHCIESFTCPVFHPMCDGIALEGVHLIVDALPRACADGRDLDARGRMQVAAAMGAVAFQKDLGATHSLAHPLSTLCGMHHGLANALCLPFVMEWNAARDPGLYQRIGIACGLDIGRSSRADADSATIAFLRQFIAKIGIDFGLRRHGVQASQLDELSRMAYQDPCHQTNPVPVAEAALREMYEAAF